MSKTQHYQIQLFFFIHNIVISSWEAAGEASKVSAISTDSGITICAVYKATVLQNKLTASLPLNTEINHATYYCDYQYH